MPTADGAAAGGDEPFTAKADNFVPTFSGKQVDYKEFRRRCDIYAAKMKLAWYILLKNSLTALPLKLQEATPRSLQAAPVKLEGTIL